MADNQTIEIYLRDEIPKFKSGQRMITVLSIGPEWVRLQCGSKKAKVAKRVWVNLLITQSRYERRRDQPTSPSKRR